MDGEVDFAPSLIYYHRIFLFLWLLLPPSNLVAIFQFSLPHFFISFQIQETAHCSEGCLSRGQVSWSRLSAAHRGHRRGEGLDSGFGSLLRYLCFSLLYLFLFIAVTVALVFSYPVFFAILSSQSLPVSQQHQPAFSGSLFPLCSQHHLFAALQKTRLIVDRDSSHYSRCGRTDKGVSALGQVWIL